MSAALKNLAGGLESGPGPTAASARGNTPDARERIRQALNARLRRDWHEASPQTLVLDAGEAGTFTIYTRAGRVFVSEGTAPNPDAVVAADPATFAEILEGHRSGLETWIKGYVRVRGSIALAMKLEGLLDHPDRPRHFPRPRRLLVDGVDTFMLEAGSGPTVVLLHGLGATNASMLPTLHALSQDYQVIAPDLPGFGDSEKPRRRYDAAYFARWVVSLLDALNVERAHLIGNSMGGRISLETGLSYPGRVERLALFAPAVAFRRLRQLVPVVRFLSPSLAALPINVPRATVLHSLRQIFSKPDRIPEAWHHAAADEFLRIFASRQGRVALLAAARHIYLDHPWGQDGFWERLRGLSRPALFLWGDRDILISSKFARHVEGALPEARSVVLEDCGHVPQFEHPDLTHDLVREFLAEG